LLQPIIPIMSKLAVVTSTRGMSLLIVSVAAPCVYSAAPARLYAAPGVGDLRVAKNEWSVRAHRLMTVVFDVLSKRLELGFLE